MARNITTDKSYLPLIVAIGLLLIFVFFLWFRVSSLENNMKPHQQQQQHHQHQLQPIRDAGRCDGGTPDTFSNPYVPPIRCDSGSLHSGSLHSGSLDRGSLDSHSGRGVPINIPTQHSNMNYSQVGIITKQLAQKNEILPLMGRRTITARDKWQYYTVAGGGAGGNLQAKLPVKVNGRNCSGEYGCQEISNGDEVYVEGYQENFRATIYENGLFSYIPN